MTTIDAIKRLAEHPGYSPVLTWNGLDYVVQADPKLVPVDDEYRVILTREQLEYYLDGAASDADDKTLQLAAEWVEDERQQWFDDAAA